MTSPTTLALVLLLAACPAAAPHDRTAAAGPASSGFTLRLAIPTIVSNDAFMWVVPFRLFNPGGMGLYTDSLVCEVDSQDPNVPERARHTVTPAFNASRLVGTVSGGDSARFEFQLPATAERGRMTIRYVGHRSNGEQLHAALQAPIEPGEAAKGIASEFVTLGTGRVEFVRMIADSATLILHGEKDDIAPLAQAQAFEAALKAAGAEASTKVIPALGHNLQGVSLRPALEFLTVQLR